MILEQRFFISYYDWAKGEFRQELAQGLPVLSKLRCTYSMPVSEFLSTLSTDQQWTFALGLLKRGVHAEGARLCGESLSHAEQDLLDKYENHTKTKNPVRGISRIGLSKSEPEVIAAIESRELVPQKPSREFQDAVWNRISESVGVPQKVERQGRTQL